MSVIVATRFSAVTIRVLPFTAFQAPLVIVWVLHNHYYGHFPRVSYASCTWAFHTSAHAMDARMFERVFMDLINVIEFTNIFLALIILISDVLAIMGLIF